MVKSQQKEAKRRGVSSPPEDVLTENVRKSRIRGKKFLKSFPDSELVEVRFEKMLKHTAVVIFRIEQFLGRTLDKERMLSVVVKRPARCMPYMMEERIYLNEENPIQEM